MSSIARVFGHDRQEKGKKRRILIAASILVFLYLGTCVELSVIAKRSLERCVQELTGGSVHIRSVHLFLIPSIHIRGKDLVVRTEGPPGIPPLVQIPRFTIDSGIIGALQNPRSLRKLNIEDMRIQLLRGSGASSQKEHGTSTHVATTIIKNSSFELLSAKPGKEPKRFEIHELRLDSPARNREVQYQTRITIPVPHGSVESSGKFGPLESKIPVSGSYRLLRCDLSSLKGLAGTLSSNGRFEGVLDRIEVTGETNSSDFTVRKGDHPINLRTQFQAFVNGRNGDTTLASVRGTFLNSAVFVRGDIKGVQGMQGKRVALMVDVDKARVEDLLKLTIKSDTAPVLGVTAITAKFDLPPGEASVWERLQLDGYLGIDRGHITKNAAQAQLNNLSNKARGDAEGPAESVVSGLRGPFTMRSGLVRFSNLDFSLPGAAARLNGTYSPRSQDIAFKGTLRLQAKLSETTTGVKSFFLKIVDPFFQRRKAGASLPVQIGGKLSRPEVQVLK